MKKLVDMLHATVRTHKWQAMVNHVLLKAAIKDIREHIPETRALTVEDFGSMLLVAGHKENYLRCAKFSVTLPAEFSFDNTVGSFDILAKHFGHFTAHRPLYDRIGPLIEA